MDLWRILEATGALLFVVSLGPQLYRTWQRRRADDVSAVFIFIVLAASFVLLPYAVQTRQWFLGVNYVANLAVWGVVFYFRLRPKPLPATATVGPA